MVKMIVGFLAKWSGAEKAWTFVNGYKTYVAAAALLLSGVAQLAGGFSAIGSAAELLFWLKALPGTPGFELIAQGVAAWGVRHAIQKGVEAK